MLRFGTMVAVAWPALLAAPAMGNERRAALAGGDARAPVVRPAAMPHRSIDLRAMRLTPAGERQRSHRLVDAVEAGPSIDPRLRARLRGVRLWETVGDDAAFAVGVSPVGGRLMGALRIAR